MTKRIFMAGLLLGAPLFLSACASDGGDGTQTAAADPGQQAADAAPGKRVNLAQCQQPSNGAVFFTVGSATMGIPAEAVRDAIPTSLKGGFAKEDIRPELQRQAATGGGCPEKPIQVRFLNWQSEPTSPLLTKNISIAAAPKGALGQLAQVTTQLQAQPTQNCKDLGGDLIGCVGTETKRDRASGQEIQTQVMYVVTTDRSAKMASGGPLSARCVLDEGKIVLCSLVDEIRGNAAYDVTLKPGKYTTAGLIAARDEVVAQINAVQR